MSVECKYCEQDARHGHADNCIWARLQAAEALLKEGATGFGRVLVATSDQKAVYDWMKRCRRFLKIRKRAEGKTP